MKSFAKDKLILYNIINIKHIGGKGMPSGPRSYGGGGSSRSGGSSGGRSNYSFRSSGFRYRHRPFRFHFGPRVYLLADKAVALLGLFICGLLFTLSGIFTNYTTMKTEGAYLNTMEADSSYYYQLVKTGTITVADIEEKYEAFYYNGYWYYQIEYSFRNSDGKLCTGRTYANYTSSQIDYMQGEIEIAYDKTGVSIPTSYILEDVEYMYISNVVSSARGRVVAYSVATAILIIISIVVIKKNLKKVEEEKQKEEAKEIAEKESIKPKYCEYCGVKVEKTDAKYGNCGANLK